ncbi:MAG: ABC transporter substrate-binding protein [Cytophagales bacterium]
MVNIRLGGVPEHFNMPLHYALEQNLFLENNINLDWVDFPGGTGAMANALKANEIDMALMLTEGAIADIENGAQNTILGFYVMSPLIWGIHVAANSSISLENEVFGNRYAISRKGSGSHLMAMVHAFQNGQKIDEKQLVIVHNLEGAIKSLIQNESDIFFWEKFMTAKYVQNDVLRRIGEFPTPWPCFVLVVKNDFFAQESDAISNLIAAIENVLQNFKKVPNINKAIAQKYKLELYLVDEWIQSVQWASKINADKVEIGNVKRMLTNFGII